MADFARNILALLFIFSLFAAAMAAETFLHPASEAETGYIICSMWTFVFAASFLAGFVFSWLARGISNRFAYVNLCLAFFLLPALPFALKFIHSTGITEPEFSLDICLILCFLTFSLQIIFFPFWAVIIYKRYPRGESESRKDFALRYVLEMFELFFAYALLLSGFMAAQKLNSYAAFCICALAFAGLFALFKLKVEPRLPMRKKQWARGGRLNFALNIFMAALIFSLYFLSVHYIWRAF
ncbi:MAG: hypothetical protein IKS15_04305 [Opitutales bacterium]|nr:hypothetical protein [Opitutales bacterium]